MPSGGLRPDEVPIDTDTVRRLVAAQFPQWSALPVTPVARSGWDNATYRLGADLAVRLPRLPRWVGQVAREQRWLPRLAPQLPLPVPTPLAQGGPGEGYPFPWSVYGWIEGETADRAPVADQSAAAVELARFFAALQGIDATGGPPPESSNGFRGTSFADERDSPVVERRIRAMIAELDGLADTVGLTAVYEAARAAPEWLGPPVWVHGDPAPTNLLTRDGRVCAVIDFGTLAVGDPACDLIVAWTLLDAGSRETFRAKLGVDDDTWARGRGWGLIEVVPSRAELAHPERGSAARRRIAELVDDCRRVG